MIDRSYLLDYVWFSKHPRSIRGGDLLVYYAAGRRVFPALVTVLADDVLDDSGGHPVYGARWRWKMAIEPIVAMPLHDAPRLSASGIDPLRLRRQSHILLSAEEYEEIRNLMLGCIDRGSALE